MFSVSCSSPSSSSPSPLLTILCRDNDQVMKIKVLLAGRGAYLCGGEDGAGESSFCQQAGLARETNFLSPGVWNQHDRHSVISKKIGVCRRSFFKECSWSCGQEDDKT